MSRTINIYLTDSQAAFVEGEIAAGRAQTVSEVVRGAIELARREREVHEARVGQLRAEMARAEAQIARGELSTRTTREIFEEAIAEHEEELRTAAG